MSDTIAMVTKCMFLSCRSDIPEVFSLTHLSNGTALPEHEMLPLDLIQQYVRNVITLILVQGTQVS